MPGTLNPSPTFAHETVIKIYPSLLLNIPINAWARCTSPTQTDISHEKKLWRRRDLNLRQQFMFPVIETQVAWSIALARFRLKEHSLICPIYGRLELLSPTARDCLPRAVPISRFAKSNPKRMLKNVANIIPFISVQKCVRNTQEIVTKKIKKNWPFLKLKEIFNPGAIWFFAEKDQQEK